jgi:hypothetical protein
MRERKEYYLKGLPECLSFPFALFAFPASLRPTAACGASSYKPPGVTCAVSTNGTKF